MKKCNIIFGSSTFWVMKKSKLLNNKIIRFDTIFSVGDLSNIDNYEINLPKNIYNKNIKYSFSNEINELNDAINDDNRIIIWTSHYEINSYLLFLYLCNYLKDRYCNLYVIYSDEYDKECYSPSCMNTIELEKLSKLERQLSKNEIIEYSNEWKMIIKNKSDMRILENKKVKLVSFNYYNSEILNLLKELGETKIIKLTSLFKSKYNLQDMIIFYFISELIKENKIKVIKEENNFLENIIVINN